MFHFGKGLSVSAGTCFYEHQEGSAQRKTGQAHAGSGAACGASHSPQKGHCTWNPLHSQVKPPETEFLACNLLPSPPQTALLQLQMAAYSPVLRVPPRSSVPRPTVISVLTEIQFAPCLWELERLELGELAGRKNKKLQEHYSNPCRKRDYVASFLPMWHCHWAPSV